MGTGPTRRPRAGIFVLAAAIGLAGIGHGTADRFPDDPVEQFKRALNIEFRRLPDFKQNVGDAYKERLSKDPAALKLAIQHRARSLKTTASRLKTAADLSRALLLQEWPGVVPKSKLEPGKAPAFRDFDTEFDRRSRDIEEAVRKEMIQRFVRLAREGLKGGPGKPPLPTVQIALCNVIAETVIADEALAAREGLELYPYMESLVPDLVAVLETTRNNEVRAAAARALGDFPRKADEAAKALKTVLARREEASPAARLAIAKALVGLVQSLTGEETMRGSEPGVALSETRTGHSKLTADRSQLVAVAAAITPVVVEGVQDPSPAVRRTCFSAERQAIAALAFMVRLNASDTFDTRERPELPPTDERPWSKTEKDRVARARERLNSDPEGLRPALTAFTTKPFMEALLRGTTDPDPATRLEARQTLDELARLRRALRLYLDTIPRENPAESDARRSTPPKKQARAKTAAKAATLVRTSGTEVVVAPKPADPMPRSLPPAPLPTFPVRRVAPPPPGRTLERDVDALGAMIGDLGDRMVQKGLRDPNPAGRRVTVEALELYGKGGEKFIPQLIASLKDPDLFVRWIAARTLGKLAPHEASRVVSALVCLLDDPDLDPRIAAANAIASYGPDAKEAVPALTERLLRGDGEVRIANMKALEAIGTDAVSALPTLAKLFTIIDPRVRAEAIRVVGRFGTSKKTREQARAYLPALRRLAEDPDTDVRKAAAAAILEIEREE